MRKTVAEVSLKGLEVPYLSQQMDGVEIDEILVDECCLFKSAMMPLCLKFKTKDG